MTVPARTFGRGALCARHVSCAPNDANGAAPDRLFACGEPLDRGQGFAQRNIFSLDIIPCVDPA